MHTPALLSDPVYHDEDAARAYIEAVRWPEFVFCPLCGAVDKISRLGGPSMGPGWWYCGSCQDKVPVRGGNGFQRLHIVLRSADTKSALMTDEAHMYRGIGRRFASHDSVNHGAEEWVRGDAHTNTVEGFFSIFKRGMVGVYQHCGEQHLHRYLTEFDFRYNTRIAVGVNDTERSENALKGIVGKRLMYRRPDEAKVS